MKKFIVILLAVVVVAAGLGGFAYAQTHEPINGQKLIGYGPHGHGQGNPDISLTTMFSLSNPDCKREITLDQISIVKSDGTEYEVNLLDDTLQPHETIPIRLISVLPPETMQQEARFYTLEVSWSAHRRCLPLIGHVVTYQNNNFEDGTSTTARDRVPMESMRQR